MRALGKALALCCVAMLAARARARSDVRVTIEPAPGPARDIPPQFLGLSFETANLLPSKRGTHLFSPQNQRLIHLFRELGIKSLRLGGGTADLPQFAVPGREDIDLLFAFAKAANVKVIYTLRLLHGNAAQAAAIAGYIQAHYAAQLDCFAIGNEPDWRSYHRADKRVRDYPSFLATWREFASAITAAAPGAKLEGPCTGSNYPDPGGKDTTYQGKTWSRNFADDEKSAPYLACITQHDYPGGDARDVKDPDRARGEMLSQEWVGGYQVLYDSFAKPAQAEGLPYRLEEVSNFSGGVAGASDTFAAALWALDFLHWWAAHGAEGINFHNRQWIRNVVIYPRPGGYALHPIGYGLKAFAEGRLGQVETVELRNPDKLNLTGYATRRNGTVYLTVINKEHGREASVTVLAAGLGAPESVLRLLDSESDASATNGVTLGGAVLSDNASWNGKWEPAGGVIDVPAASAAIIKIPEL